MGVDVGGEFKALLGQALCSIQSQVTGKAIELGFSVVPCCKDPSWIAMS